MAFNIGSAFMELLNNLEEAVIFVDSSFKVKGWNQAATNILEYSLNETLERNILDIITLDGDFAKDFHFLEQALLGEASFEKEIKRKTKSGKWIDTSTKYFPINYENNNQVGIGVILTNISQQRRDARIIEESHKVAKIGGWELDPLTRNIFLTKQAQEIFSFISSSNIHLEQLLKNLDQKYYSEFNNLINESLETGQGKKIIFTIKCQGKTKWIQANWHIQTKNFKTIKLYGIFRDITEEKLKQDIIDNDRIQMIKAKKLSSIAQLAAGLAHEINNPLAIMNGYLQLIHDLVADGKFEAKNRVEKFVVKSVAAGERIAKIIATLKGLTRDSISDQFFLASLKQILADVLVLCQENLKRKNIEIDVEWPKNFKDLTVECHPNEIMQVFINLIYNSIDAIAEQERPWIKLRIDGNHHFAKVSVIDSGLGIKEEIADQIMTPFFTEREPNQGIGLGLSISKKLMENSKGTLEYIPESKNTTFLITIPCREVEYIEAA